MLGDLFLGSIIRGALGTRSKPHGRAARFLTGGSPRFGLGLNLGTLLGAAGVAWGAYEHFADRTPKVLTTVEGGGFAAGAGGPPPSLSGPPPSLSGPPPIPSRSSSSSASLPSTPPPLPSAAADTPSSTMRGPDALRRLVALTIAAARVDGELGEEEYGKILASAREHGAEKFVQEELANRRTIQEIVVGAMPAAFREQLYALAFGIVRADASVSSAERKWLRELALALDFDNQSAARMEQVIGTKIDRQIA